MAFNTLVDQQPAGIALPRSADDVSAVVRSAAATGKRVAAQRTGHNAEPLGSLANTVLLRTDGLGGVQINADEGSARVGAGVLWGELLPNASELGLATLHGSAAAASAQRPIDVFVVVDHFSETRDARLCRCVCDGLQFASHVLD